MPRSYDDIMKHAEELSRHLHDKFRPSETPEEAALKAAAFRRAQAESDLADAVIAAAEAGRSWPTALLEAVKAARRHGRA